MALGADFRRLWAAYAVSDLGTALAIGALPLIATVVLHAPVAQVSLLTALAGLAGAALAVPLGPWIEFRPKRPVMIGADLLRCGALLTVPAAAALGALTYTQLCLVAMAQAVGTIAFQAAGGAHLKALVPGDRLGDATSRLEGSFWTAYTAGPPLGGLLMSWLGATASVAADAVTFLLSALGLSRLRDPEPPPPQRTAQARLPELATGWRYLLAHPELRALFFNALLFGGCVMASQPLLTVLMLRDLGLAPWQYGVAMGVPCLGGVLGALIVRPFTRRHGARRALLWFGSARGLGLAALPFAPSGTAGLLVISASQVLLLTCAGAFNPTFAAFRLAVTGDEKLSRVLAAWAISSRVAQPVVIVLGGLLAAVAGVRGALLALAVLLMASAALLPWRTVRRPDPVPAAR